MQTEVFLLRATGVNQHLFIKRPYPLTFTSNASQHKLRQIELSLSIRAMLLRVGGSSNNQTEDESSVPIFFFDLEDTPL